MTVAQALALFIAAVLGGTLNAVAGGGSFFTFPTLLLIGVPSVQANATSTVALWPGTVASVGAYRRELRIGGRLLLLYGVIGVLGGVCGAQILLHIPSAVFLRMVPFLLLISTLLFAFGSQLTRALRERLGNVRTTDAKVLDKQSSPAAGVSRVVAPLALFVLSVYGGFFGGGLGILLLSVLAFLGMESIHSMNALKTTLTACINGAAVITFIVDGAVFWPQALVMVLGAIAGGYGGATLAQRVPQVWVRRFVIAVGLGLSVYFFIRK